MKYIDLIMDKPLIWGLFALYLVVTSWLAWLGHKKTTDIESFSVGAGDMNPIVVGVTLAASIASTATFVINPGFVYAHGISALLHLGVAAGSGVIVGLFVMSFGFRRVGKKHSALTIPQWMGQRYGSQAMTIFFAAVNMLSLTFLVLIVGSLSIVMQATLGLSNFESVFFIIVFVFSYIFVGGTYAHAYTNTLQGIIMVIIAGMIVWSGLHFLSDGFGPVLERLSAVNPDLAKGINPSSVLFSSVFSVWVSGFIIGFALVSQPHIMIKALYVKQERDIWKYLGVCVAVSLVFSALLLVGLYAHMMELPPELFVDAQTGKFKQDLVMTVYLQQTFGDVPLAIIMVALMSAGMSTLDGILIALSSIAANDLFLNIARHNLLADADEKKRSLMAHRAGQVILIVLGIITFFIALEPPALLGIFGQLGVYGIVAASLAPLLAGIVFDHIDRRVVFASSIVALITHFGLYAGTQVAMKNKVDLVTEVKDLPVVSWFFDTSAFQLGFANPGVTATYGIIVSLMIVLVGGLLSRRKGSEQPAAAVEEPA